VLELASILVSEEHRKSPSRIVNPGVVPPALTRQAAGWKYAANPRGVRHQIVRLVDACPNCRGLLQTNLVHGKGKKQLHVVKQSMPLINLICDVENRLPCVQG
jgi:hypothetical protein